MKTIRTEHGHWQLLGELKELLLECRAEEESSKYPLKGVCVTENALVSTDGRRLVEVKCSHKIPPGTYYVSEDGYLLETTGMPFPKYKDVIPKDTRRIVKVKSDVGEDIIGLILGELCHAGCIIKLSLYQRPAEIMSSIIEGNVEVYVHKDVPAENPFLIKAKTTIGDVQYVQMPITVKNEL